MPKDESRAIYVATTSFSCEHKGMHYNVKKGERVRHGHPILAGREVFFDLADEGVTYDVEEAVAPPGKKRGEQ